MIETKIIDPIFPCNVWCHFLVYTEGGVEILGKDGTELGLEDIYPEILVVLFFVLLLEKFVEIVEVYYSNLVGCFG